MTLLRLGHALGVVGNYSDSDVVFQRAIGISRASPRRIFEGGVSALQAETLLWRNDCSGALHLAKRALVLAEVGGEERDFIRATRREGTAALCIGDKGFAFERLYQALNRACAANYFEEELPTLTALAELHRRKNDLSTARELLNQVWNAAERGPYPLLHADALNVLAQIERDQGNRAAAIAAATKAYKLAWCDGISADGKVCYAYHYGLTNARKLLQELGAPEPQLPPFDESKFPPLPDVELNPKDEFWVDPASLESNP